MVRASKHLVFSLVLALGFSASSVSIAAENTENSATYKRYVKACAKPLTCATAFASACMLMASTGAPEAAEGQCPASYTTGPTDFNKQQLACTLVGTLISSLTSTHLIPAVAALCWSQLADAQSTTEGSSQYLANGVLTSWRDAPAWQHLEEALIEDDEVCPEAEVIPTSLQRLSEQADESMQDPELVEKALGNHTSLRCAVTSGSTNMTACIASNATGLSFPPVGNVASCMRGIAQDNASALAVLNHIVGAGVVKHLSTYGGMIVAIDYRSDGTNQLFAQYFPKQKSLTLPHTTTGSVSEELSMSASQSWKKPRWIKTGIIARCGRMEYSVASSETIAPLPNKDLCIGRFLWGYNIGKLAMTWDGVNQIAGNQMGTYYGPGKKVLQYSETSADLKYCNTNTTNMGEVWICTQDY